MHVLQLKRMTMTEDGKGAVFDVDSEMVDEFMSKCSDTTSTDGHLITPTALPPLKHKVRLEDYGPCTGLQAGPVGPAGVLLSAPGKTLRTATYKGCSKRLIDQLDTPIISQSCIRIQRERSVLAVPHASYVICGVPCHRWARV
jgi:hypothetical protein